MHVVVLSFIDSSYENSKIIKGLRVGNNGFYVSSNVLSEDKMDEFFVDGLIKPKNEIETTETFYINKTTNEMKSLDILFAEKSILAYDISSLLFKCISIWFAQFAQSNPEIW